MDDSAIMSHLSGPWQASADGHWESHVAHWAIFSHAIVPAFLAFFHAIVERADSASASGKW